MKKLTTVVAAAALAIASAAPVTGFAQNAAPHAIVTAPDHSVSVRSLLGVAVYNAQRQKIGTIETVMVQPSGEPNVVVSVGDYLGTGPKLVAVPLSHLTQQGKDSMEMASATKAMLASLPSYSVAGG